MQVFSAVDAELNGRVSVTSGSILLCSFYGEFTDPHSGAVVSIPPVQCYRDQPSSELQWNLHTLGTSIFFHFSEVVPSSEVEMYIGRA